MDPATGSLDRTLRAGFQSMLLSEDGRTFDQLSADQDNGPEVTASELPLGKQVLEFSLPYLLDERDRRALEAVLPQLPPLSYPMSDEAAAAFLDAYYDLVERPAWEPVLMTAADIERRRAEQVHAMERHQRALREAFGAGQMIAVDRHHVHVKELISGTFIPREDAIAYLRNHRLARVASDAGTASVESNVSVQPESRGTTAARSPRSNVARDEHTETAPRAQRKRDNAEPATDAESLSQPQSDAVTKKVGRVVRLEQVMKLTGLGRSSIYNRMDERSEQYDPTFPRNFPLGPMAGSAVGWDEEKVAAWVAAQADRAMLPRSRRAKRSTSQ